MRILHVTDTYLPTVGGIEILVRDLSSRQALAGHDVTVLTRTADGASTAAETGDPGVRVVRDSSRVAELLGHADVVHAHISALSPTAFLAAEAAGRTGVPVVATVHSMWTGTWPLYRGLAASRRWSTLPIQWAAVSGAAAEPVGRAMGGRGGVLVLPNAVDLDLWTPNVPAPSHEGATLLSVLRMTRRKRPLALAEMLARVRAQVPQHIPLRAILVGDGPDLPALRRRVSRSDLSGWVELPGALDHAHIRDLYRDADLYLAPAGLESFGIAALEARAAGLAVVARRGSGVGEFVVDGVDGALVGNDAEMVAATARLVGSARELHDIRAHNHTVRPLCDWPEVLLRTELAYAAAGARANRPVAGWLPAGAVN